MNTFFKRLFSLTLVIAVCSGFTLAEQSAFSLSIAPIKAAQATTITPRAPIIEWRFKAVDGKLYKRQYNCSTQEWIGEWELIP